MEPRFYEDIEEFYKVAYPFLMKNEAENNLPLAILISLKKNIKAYGETKPLLFSLIDYKTVKLIALRTPPHDLIISYTDDLSTIEVLTEELTNRGENLPGVLSFKDAADKFAEKWCEKNFLKNKLFRKERVFKLVKVSEETLGNRKFSVAQKDHQEIVFQWAGEMMKEALINTMEEDIQGMIEILREEFDQYKSRMYLLFDNKEPVSMAREAGKTPNGVFVNFVYTPIPLRRRGYATECVAKLSKHLLELGNRYCFLFTDLSNPTSNSIYKKIGYQPVIDENHYKFMDNN
jgi:RimJ/RimL family protein N-acetyltransferase